MERSSPDHLHYQAMPKFKPLPPLEELKKEFVYSPDTGLFLHAYYKCGRARQHQVAGTIGRKGYVVLRHRDIQYQAHRIAWLFGYGQDPGASLIDHIDQDKANNCLHNLRLSNDNLNQWNRKARGWHKRGSRYQACIRIYGKLLHLGTYDTAEEAQAAYQAKAVELRGDYAPGTYKAS